MALYNRKLTDEVQETIVESLENGLSIAAACGRARISKPTFYNWYNRGAEAKSGKYKNFHDAVDNAKDVAQSNFEVVITSAADKGTWQAAAWWLERRRPEMYKLKESREIDAKVQSENTNLNTNLNLPIKSTSEVLDENADTITRFIERRMHKSDTDTS